MKKYLSLILVVSALLAACGTSGQETPEANEVRGKIIVTSEWVCLSQTEPFCLNSANRISVEASHPFIVDQEVDRMTTKKSWLTFGAGSEQLYFEDFPCGNTVDIHWKWANWIKRREVVTYYCE